MVFAFLLVSIESSAQLDTVNPVYHGFKKIIRSINIGYFGCDYQSISYIGNDGRVARSEIHIPNNSSLNIDFEYNDNGDIVRQEYSTSEDDLLVFEYLYVYDTLDVVYDDIVAHKIKEQRTVINGLDTITISVSGNQSLRNELKILLLIRYASIFQLIKEAEVSPRYFVPRCNCTKKKDITLLDELFAARLGNVLYKDGFSVLSDQVKLILIANRRKDRYGNWQIRKIKANYKDEIFTIEKIKYKK